MNELSLLINVGEHGRSNHTMDNPEKPVTQDASNEEII
jgi:hypothetical protein